MEKQVLYIGGEEKGRRGILQILLNNKGYTPVILNDLKELENQYSNNKYHAIIYDSRNNFTTNEINQAFSNMKNENIVYLGNEQNQSQSKMIGNCKLMKGGVTIDQLIDTINAPTPSDKSLIKNHQSTYSQMVEYLTHIFVPQYSIHPVKQKTHP